MSYTKLKYSIMLGLFFTGACAAEDFSALSQFVEKSKTTIDPSFGTAIAIVKGDKVIYEGYFGYADIDKQIKVDANTAFYIASSTKPFFALATLLAESRGDVKDSTTLKALFPKLKFKDINAEKVTVKHLLSHSTGIYNEPLQSTLAYTGLHNNDLRHKMVAASYPDKKTDLNEFNYSNMGYNILSVWFDDYYKRDWQKTLQQTVFAPLKLNRTSAYMSDADKNKWTVPKPYSVASQDKKEPLYLMKQDNTMQAAGGMIATASDLAKFVIAQLNEGKVNGEQIFPASVIKKSHEKLVDVDKNYGNIKRFGYAWGWYIGEYQDQVLYHHFGGFAGASAHVSFMPEHKIGLVVLNNESVLGVRLMQSIADIVYGRLLRSADISSLVANKQSALDKDMQRMQQGLANNAKKMATREWDLSLDRKDYTGKYSHPLMGVITIVLNRDKQFLLDWGNLKAIATPYTKTDTMRVEFVPDSGRVMQFEVVKGKAVRINYDNLIFEKL